MEFIDMREEYSRSFEAAGRNTSNSQLLRRPFVRALEPALVPARHPLNGVRRSRDEANAPC
jgi:hypothetical protein